MTQNNMEVVELIEALRDGVPRCGMHDDNTTELFDIEDANDAMYRAAEALTSAQAEIERLTKERDALRVEVAAAKEFGGGFFDHSVKDEVRQVYLGRALSALQPLEPKND